MEFFFNILLNTDLRHNIYQNKIFIFIFHF